MDIVILPEYCLLRTLLSYQNIGYLWTLLSYQNIGYLWTLLSYQNIGYLWTLLSYQNIGYLRTFLSYQISVILPEYCYLRHCYLTRWRPFSPVFPHPRHVPPDGGQAPGQGEVPRVPPHHRGHGWGEPRQNGGMYAVQLTFFVWDILFGLNNLK